MRICTTGAATLVIGVMAVPTTGKAQESAMSTDALIESLKKGGYVMVMRHASAPREAPDKQTANSDNTKLERQLDEAGRAGATAMGKALRDMKIPIGSVLTSPTYRAVETVRSARLANPHVHEELGDGGQSMQGVTDTQATWLRDRAAQLPEGTNTIIVTHMPNIARAFPNWGTVADGEVVVVCPDGHGGTRSVGRITIEQWSRIVGLRKPSSERDSPATLAPSTSNGRFVSRHPATGILSHAASQGAE